MPNDVAAKKAGSTETVTVRSLVATMVQNASTMGCVSRVLMKSLRTGCSRKQAIRTAQQVCTSTISGCRSRRHIEAPEWDAHMFQQGNPCRADRKSGLTGRDVRLGSKGDIRAPLAAARDLSPLTNSALFMFLHVIYLTLCHTCKIA